MIENHNEPPLGLSMSVVQGEMSPLKRWLYRMLLVVVAAIVGALISLWATEPEPLPTRLHIAFAAMTAIGVGWICVLTWLLIRRHGTTAVDRIATGWMATIACTVSLVLSVAIALNRGNNWAALVLAILGMVLLVIAILLLRSGYAFRSSLLASLKEFEKTTRLLLCAMIGLVWFAGSPSIASANEQLELVKTTIESRSGAAVEAEFGRLPQLVFHAKPGGKRLKIAFIRVRGKVMATPSRQAENHTSLRLGASAPLRLKR